MRLFTLKCRSLFGVSIAFIALVLVFVGGFFSSSTNFEKIAEYATSVVQNNTNSKKFCAITVGKTTESGQLPKASVEFQNLYGVFRQEKITFASTINADKQHDIRIEKASTDNLTFLYCGGVGTIDYHGHYKHHMLPIEVMFPDERIYDTFSYVVYISQQHADSILEKNNVQKIDGSYLPSDYQSLLHCAIDVTVDGLMSTFGIQNIFYQSNYYYSGLNEVVGDFAMVSYYLPFNLTNDQCNMYFLSEFSYQNRYFMNYINETYSSGKYSVKINHFNIISDFDEDYLLSFYYDKIISQSNWLSISFFALSGSLMIVSMLLLIIGIKKTNKHIIWMDYIVCFFPLFVPYLIFASLYKFTGDVIFMSEPSSKINGIYILVYIFVFLIWNLKQTKHKSDTEKIIDNYYEFDI